MGVVELSFLIDGQKVTVPKEWQDIKVQSAFGRNSNQPQIESDRFTLVKDAAQKVIDWVSAGNIFEGLPATLIHRERNNQITVFEGFIDTSDNYEELNPSFGADQRPIEISVKFRGQETITNFLDQIEGVTYGYLYEVGSIKDSDFVTIKTAIVKKTSFIEVAMTVVSIYVLSKQIADTVKELPDTIANTTGHAGGGLTGPVAAAVYAIAIAVTQVVYVITTVAIVVSMIKQLIDLLIPPLVNNKGITYYQLLDLACKHFNYKFVSNIKELFVYHYLPTKGYTNETNILNGLIPKLTPTQRGIPSNGDFGYLISEMFELCKRMFRAKVDVIGNEVHLRNEEDPYWLTVSTFTPSINLRFDSGKYNTADLKQTRLLTFATDPNDEWTIENYTGTSYEVKTEPSNPNNVQNVVIKGLDRVEFPVALPSVKKELTPVEQSMFNLAVICDSFTSLLGSNTNLANTIKKNRVNVLKVSQNDYSVAKCVPLINGVLLPTQRNILSARYLNNNFYDGASWVVGQKLGQKRIYENVEFPFNLHNYNQTLKSGIFVLPDGRKARFIDILEWQLGADTATANLEVYEVYTNKLKEVYHEP